MLTIRCRNCGKLLEGHSTQMRSCQCPNITSIRGTHISGKDLSMIELVNQPKNESSGFTAKDLEWQEQRRKRKIRKLDFEER